MRIGFACASPDSSRDVEVEHYSHSRLSLQQKPHSKTLRVCAPAEQICQTHPTDRRSAHTRFLSGIRRLISCSLAVQIPCRDLYNMLRDKCGNALLPAARLDDCLRISVGTDTELMRYQNFTRDSILLMLNARRHIIRPNNSTSATPIASLATRQVGVLSSRSQARIVSSGPVDVGTFPLPFPIRSAHPLKRTTYHLEAIPHPCFCCCCF